MKKVIKLDRKTLISMVKKEANNIRKHATQDELDNLSFNRLDPDHKNKCIYGQMTGDCTHDRAKELIKASCVASIANPEGGADLLNKMKLHSPEETSSRREGIFGGIDYLSPIEIFILRKENKKHNNKVLIDYLKGNRKTLAFKY